MKKILFLFFYFLFLSLLPKGNALAVLMPGVKTSTLILTQNYLVKDAGRSGADTARSIVIDSSGNIFLAGYGYGATSSSRDFILMKFGPDGTPDTTFGSKGIISQDGGAIDDDNAYSVALDSSGNIFVGGSGFGATSSSRDFILMKFGPDGNLDTTFGSNGIVVQDGGAIVADDYGYSVALDSSGNILVGGSGFGVTSSSRDFILMKFDPNGNPDTTFGSNGIAVEHGGEETENNYVQSIVLDSSGNIFVGGYGYGSSLTNLDFILMKFDPDGNLDTTFGSNGIVVQDEATLTNDEYAKSIALDSSGNIFVGGDVHAGSSPNTDLILMKFDPDGTPDTTFGSNGIVLEGSVTEYNYCESISIDSSGNILVGGSGYGATSSSRDFILMKFGPDGNLDTTFGSNGIVVQDGGAMNSDNAYSVALDSSGNVFVGGSGRGASSSTSDFMVMKYQSNGKRSLFLKTIKK